jgi:hypothetical protein
VLRVIELHVLVRDAVCWCKRPTQKVTCKLLDIEYLLLLVHVFHHSIFIFIPLAVLMLHYAIAF